MVLWSCSEILQSFLFFNCETSVRGNIFFGFFVALNDKISRFGDMVLIMLLLGNTAEWTSVMKVVVGFFIGGILPCANCSWCLWVHLLDEPYQQLYMYFFIYAG